MRAILGLASVAATLPVLPAALPCLAPLPTTIGLIGLARIVCLFPASDILCNFRTPAGTLEVSWNSLEASDFNALAWEGTFGFETLCNASGLLGLPCKTLGGSA